jgi:DNA-binding response OmpR family regulator
MPAPRVLVVDDEPLLREMLAESLFTDGWDVVVAGDAAEALRQAEITVAVVDAVLPGGTDGFRLTRLLEARGVPVLMISGHAESLDRLTADPRPILAKPFRVAAFLTAVRKLSGVEPAGRRAQELGVR